MSGSPSCRIRCNWPDYVNARQRLAEVARGREPADLVLTNGRIFDVLSGDLVAADLAILGDRIAGVGSYDGLQSLDVRGRIILPGFIDAGAELEASHLTIGEYARIVSSHGTTAAIFDFRAIAAVLGLQGLTGMLDDGARSVLDALLAAPLWCGRRWDTAAARFDAMDPTFLSLPGLVARGGSLNGRALIDAGASVLAAGDYDAYLPVIVEGAGLTNTESAALAALGAAADRTWNSPEEALAKLRQGYWLLAAEGTLASSAADLKWLARSARLDRICLVSGSCTAADLVSEGHLNAALRRVVRAGVAAGDAIRMVTSQPAALFGLHDRGALLPGRKADIVVVDDLRTFTVNLVIRHGRPVARLGASLLPPALPPAPLGYHSIHSAVCLAEHLTIRGHAGPCRVIGLEDNGDTTSREGTPRWGEGALHANPALDLIKVAVLERHTASGRCGLGFVQGLGLREGAICCSFAGAGQNLIVAGADDANMALAVQHVAADGGGMVVLRNRTVAASVSLPSAGLLSPLPAEELVAALQRVEAAAWELGCDAVHPFLALASLADARTGELRITEQGLVDVANQRLLALQD